MNLHFPLDHPRWDQLNQTEHPCFPSRRYLKSEKNSLLLLPVAHFSVGHQVRTVAKCSPNCPTDIYILFKYWPNNICSEISNDFYLTVAKQWFLCESKDIFGFMSPFGVGFPTQPPFLWSDSNRGFMKGFDSGNTKLGLILIHTKHLLKTKGKKT